MNSINLGFDIGVNTDVGPSLLASDLLNNSAEKLELFRRDTTVCGDERREREIGAAAKRRLPERLT